MAASVMMNIKIAKDGMFLNPDTRNTIFDGVSQGMDDTHAPMSMSEDVDQGRQVREALVKFSFEKL